MSPVAGRRLSTQFLREHIRPRIDRDLARYIIRDEYVVAAVRQHWASQAAPVGALAAALVLATTLDVSAPPTPGGQLLANLGWLALAASGAWCAWRLVNWRHDWFVATDKRFLLFEGFFWRRVSMMPLEKVTDLTFDRSPLGRVLGYGAFRLESAGQDQALSRLDFLPHAETLYRDICTVMFGDPDPNGIADRWPGDDDSGWGDRTWDDGPRGPRGHGSTAPDDPSEDRGADGQGPHRLARGGADPRPATAPGSRQRARPAEQIYSSAESARERRLADTGELPVIVPAPMPRPRGRRWSPRPQGGPPLYVPEDWTR